MKNKIKSENTPRMLNIQNLTTRIGRLLLLTGVFLFSFFSCSTPNGGGDFVAVTNITGVPTTATAGIGLTLTGTAAPANATNKTIAWTVKSAGSTGAAITGNIFNTTAEGTVTLTATIVNGAGIGSNYTKDFSIIVSKSDDSFIAITDITGVPVLATVGTPFTLTGTIAPANAANKAIAWSIKSAGTTGAGISGNILTATGVGTVTVTATITNGTAVGSDYTKDFDITVTDAFKDAAKLSAYLDSLPANTTASPVAIRAIVNSSTIESFVDVIYSTDKYITLDLTESSITEIGDNAFRSCYALTSVTIPDSVTTIGDNAFSYCRRLTSVSIPDSVIIIGNNAFYDSRLRSVSIPDSVTTIGENAFSWCNLTSVTIPDSVTTIGDNAFSACEYLEAFIVAPGNTNYKAVDGILYTVSGKTLLCPQRKTGVVTIPDSITTIGENAFFQCDGLTSVTIPDSVTTIGDKAFSYCEGLTNVTIPDSVTTIGNEAFSTCTGLTSVTIPDSVTTIGDKAFDYCEGLTNVTIGDSVITIGEYAFRCDNLISVTFDKSGISIGEYAFPYSKYSPNSSNTLKTMYATGGSGTYTRGSNTDDWTKQ